MCAAVTWCAVDRLTVDVHFTPLLLELAATVPVGGPFLLEADVEGFGSLRRSGPRRTGQRSLPQSGAAARAPS